MKNKLGRPKNSTRPKCSDCNQSHMAGAECPWPEQDNRYQPRRDSDLLNVLDHRIHGLDEVIKDLHYNDGFKMMFRSAMPILKKLRDFYQNQYDTVSVRVEEERNKKKAS